MMASSSQPTEQNITTTTSNLPDYAKPYYTNLMQSAQGLLSQPYTPYEQQRVADFTPEQQQVQSDVANLQTPSQYGLASGLAAQSGLGALQSTGYDPASFTTQQVGIGGLNNYQMANPGTFGTQQAQQYMSPYITSVLDYQKQNAVHDAQQAQLAQNLGAAAQGTYGGSRQLLASLDREKNLQDVLAGIDANGLQSAYTNAQQQFNTEQGLQQNANIQNLQALLGVQQLGTQSSLQASLANQQADLQAQQAAEQSRQFGAQQALAGYTQAGDMAGTLANIGTQQNAATLADLGLQQQTAAQQQSLDQQKLDTAYQDYLGQRDYPLEMLQQYNSLLRGVPVTPDSTSTVYGQSPSTSAQILGAGLGALGTAKTLGA